MCVRIGMAGIICREARSMLSGCIETGNRRVRLGAAFSGVVFKYACAAPLLRCLRRFVLTTGREEAQLSRNACQTAVTNGTEGK